MKTIFTKSTINWGCYNNYGQRKQDSIWFTEDLTIDDILNADIPLKDKSWFIRKNCQFTTDEYHQFAIGCALCVLPIYEAKYPGNNAPRAAIQAAKDYLAGVITIDAFREKRRAAAYAAVVADAAAAAYAAAVAADAAAAAAAAVAAAAAAYAAAAAVADADAAAAAAYAAVAADAADAKNGKPNYQELLLQFFKEFTSIKEIV